MRFNPAYISELLLLHSAFVARSTVQTAWNGACRSGFRMIVFEESFDHGVKAVIAEAHRAFGDGATSVSSDVDGHGPVDVVAA